MPRNIEFQYGRIDCTEQLTGKYPFDTKKPEEHPLVTGNGKNTVDFFKKNFGFNGREIVAIMGAHTMGRMHHDVALFRYVWTTSGINLFNNHYYK